MRPQGNAAVATAANYRVVLVEHLVKGPKDPTIPQDEGVAKLHVQLDAAQQAARHLIVAKPQQAAGAGNEPHVLVQMLWALIAVITRATLHAKVQQCRQSKVTSPHLPPHMLASLIAAAHA
jgi:hypothetical protein